MRPLTIGMFGVLIALPASFAQTPGEPYSYSGALDSQQPVALLSPEQLDNLVAPVALYPDPLLSQVLAASTYPREIADAQQWLVQSSYLQGTQLLDAARQQNWDPSVQALVAFPDAVRLLASDIRWTTDLGNAFLSQEADVMGAIQRMRARARATGRLNSTPQQVVTMQAQDGQNAIEIQPADPQVIYVPIYSPSYVWGRPVWDGYYDMWYPSSFGWGFGYGRGIYMSSYFPRWSGWGGWGWNYGWSGRSMYVNTGFFNRYGFRGGGGYGGGYGGYGRSGGGYGYSSGRGDGRTAWAHNPDHRMGVMYPNRSVASRYNSNSYGSNYGSNLQPGGRAGAGSYRQGASDFGSRNGRPSQNYQAPSQNPGVNGNGTRRGGGYSAPGQNYSAPETNQNQRTTGGSGYSTRRSNSDPSQTNSAPQTYQSPRSTGGGGYATPRSSSDPSQTNSAPQIYQSPRSTGGGAYSTPRSYAAPSQTYSAPEAYQSRRSTGGGGYSSPRSYSDPSQTYSAPQTYQSPRSTGGGGYSSPRSYSAPSQSYSAPQMYQSQRSTGGGGGGGYSAPRSFSAPSPSRSAPQSYSTNPRGSSGSSEGRSGGGGGRHR